MFEAGRLVSGDGLESPVGQSHFFRGVPVLECQCAPVRERFLEATKKCGTHSDLGSAACRLRLRAICISFLLFQWNRVPEREFVLLLVPVSPASK